MRMVTALLCGALFGAGLFVSGMTDTLKVQGFLDIFGAWNPTLAFVLGGAILPMALAWRVATGRERSLLGAPLPGPPPATIDRRLIAGSALFGAGWALAGLCPGPALASLSFGGARGLVFILAMAAGMLAAGPIGAHLFASIRKGTAMDIRPLTDSYAVSPQIALDDFPAIRAAGYVTVIDNRPDGEIPADLHTARMRAAAEAAGLRFVANPIIGGAMTMANVEAQKVAMAESSGPVFAYCASGNRSSQVWALAHAGTRPTDELISIPARFGYQLEGLRGQIDMLATRG